MKPKSAGALGALLLVAGLGLASGSYAAGLHGHETDTAHGHGSAGTLQLNAGKKWETDAALRSSMAQIRQALDASLPKIHDNKLAAAGYGALARKVEGEVGNIVKNCKLEPEADAQLHLIVADLLAGAEQMAGKVKHTKRQGGAVKVVTALINYGKYFDDPQFTPPEH
ncbi:MAG: hypothetical protein ACK4F6_15215 [Hylemonella sp.]